MNTEEGKGGPWPFPKSLGQNICLSLQSKTKIIKEDNRNGEKRNKEDFSYVSKGMLKLIISNINF